MTNPCENCVFYSKACYGVVEYEINTHCYHPIFKIKNEECPTVASYQIKKNLGLIKEEGE